MAHLLSDQKDISVLKAYWVNHAIDQNQNVEYGERTNKRQTCVGVYGIDIHPDGSRFATCGADQKIKIWSMAPIIDVDIEVSECVDKLLCVCKYDQTSNNNANVQTFNNTIHCVEWSNNGQYLASGAADGIVTIWKLSQNVNHNNHNHINTNNNINNNMNNNTKNIENWVIAQQLTKHREEASASNTSLTTDVQDVVWSVNDVQLISAGSDHNIIIWNKINANNNNNNNNNNQIFECMQIIKDAHDDIILGLSFDPIGDFLLSQSADGSAKIWAINHNNNRYAMHHKMSAEFKKRSNFIGKNANDDLTRLDVCQRGSFSADGLHILTSFGVTKDNIFISPIYNRKTFENEHSFVGHSKPTTVSKWNPRIYQSNESEIFHIAAIGSMDRKLSIWATNKCKPIIVFTEIGRESLLDMSWSRSGDILMASTHDGNVMVFIFGKHVFKGNKLSIEKHLKYINYCYENRLHTNRQTNITSNITLQDKFRFNKIKQRQTHTAEEKQNELSTNNGNDSESEYIPAANAFGPQEQTQHSENNNHNFEINFTEIKFDAIEGKQKSRHNITDYYNTQNETLSSMIHATNNMTESNHSSRSPNNNKNNNNVNNASVLRNNNNNNIKEKKKKRKDKFKRKRDNDNNEPRKKKRKYNERLIKMEHAENISFEIAFNNNFERGVFKIECKNNKNNSNNNNTVSVCEFKQFKSVNSRQILLWKTEIPSFITQCVCNEKWTICGSLDGELYCFDNNGMIIIPPIQIEEEIVFLYLSQLYAQNKSNIFIENNNIYLMIITSDCILRVWKLNKNMIGFEPQPIVKTNFSHLLIKNKKNKKDISLKNGYITNDGKIILTLTNNYVFTYKQSLDVWLRIYDNKYPLSNYMNNNNNMNNINNNNNNNEIGKLELKFSQLLKSMNESNTNNNSNNNNTNTELREMHTISHLEQELITLCLLNKNKEIEFEDIMKKYVEQLLNSLKFKSLSFNAMNKLNKIFDFLLNCNENPDNNWCGSVISQRKLLHSLIQIITQKNIDVRKEYYPKLKELTNKYGQALHSCQNDTI